LPDDAVFKGYRSVVVQDLKIEPQNTGSYAQIDDTSARVNGRNHHTQIVCGEHYAAYFTTERKDRLTVLDVLRRFRSREFLFDDEVERLLEQLRVSKKARAMLAGMPRDERMSEERFDAVLAEVSRGTNVAPITLTRIKEAAAIAAYHKETGVPVVEVLLCDDAPQFKLLTVHLQHPELPLHTTTPASSRRALRRAAATSASTPEPTKAPPPATR
jgi:hypothetical protein